MVFGGEGEGSEGGGGGGGGGGGELFRKKRSAKFCGRNG